MLQDCKILIGLRAILNSNGAMAASKPLSWRGLRKGGFRTDRDRKFKSWDEGYTSDTGRVTLNSILTAEFFVLLVEGATLKKATPVRDLSTFCTAWHSRVAPAYERDSA
jgi:hypothetical protein